MYCGGADINRLLFVSFYYAKALVQKVKIKKMLADKNSGHNLLRFSVINFCVIWCLTVELILLQMAKKVFMPIT